MKTRELRVHEYKSKKIKNKIIFLSFSNFISYIYKSNPIWIFKFSPCHLLSLIIAITLICISMSEDRRNKVAYNIKWHRYSKPSVTVIPIISPSLSLRRGLIRLGFSRPFFSRHLEPAHGARAVHLQPGKYK